MEDKKRLLILSTIYLVVLIFTSMRLITYLVNKSAVVSFKKLYSAYTQALDITVNDMDGDTGCYFSSDRRFPSKYSGCDRFYKTFATNLRVTKYCKNNAFSKGCLPEYKSYAKTPSCAGFSENMMNRYIQKFKYAGRNVKLLKKILKTSENLPYPGELKNLLKTSLAFSNPNNKYDYLKRLYDTLNSNSVTDTSNCLKTLQDKGFTVRDIEILTGVSKSQVSRKIKEVK